MQQSVRKPASERRRQLAQEALRIIAEGGTRLLTAKRLGEAVGISDGAVFKHYPTMEAVVDAAIVEFEALLVVPKEVDVGDPLRLLRQFVVNRINLVRARPELLELAFSRNLENVAGTGGAARVRRVIVNTNLYVKKCLDRAQRAGSVRAGVRTTVLTWMLQGAIQAAGKQTVRRLSPEEVWCQVALVLTSRTEEREG